MCGRVGRVGGEQAHKKGDGSTLRPALSAALTPDKFDSWLEVGAIRL